MTKLNLFERAGIGIIFFIVMCFVMPIFEGFGLEDWLFLIIGFFMILHALKTTDWVDSIE